MSETRYVVKYWRERSVVVSSFSMPVRTAIDHALQYHRQGYGVSVHVDVGERNPKCGRTVLSARESGLWPEKIARRLSA